MRSPVSKGSRSARVVLLRVLGGLCVIASVYSMSATFSHVPPQVAVGMSTAATNVAALLLLLALLVPRVRRLLGIRYGIGIAESWSSYRGEILRLSILPVVGHIFLLSGFELIAQPGGTEPAGSRFGYLLFGSAFMIAAVVSYGAAAKVITSMGRGTPGGPEGRHPLAGLALGGLLNTGYSLLAIGLTALAGFPALTWQAFVASACAGAMTLFAMPAFLRLARVAKS